MADQLIDVADNTQTSAAVKRGVTATGITAITRANPAVITVANDMVVGDIIRFSACGGMTKINGLTATIASRTATTITTDLNTLGTQIGTKVVQTTDNLNPAVINSTAHGLVVGQSVVFTLMDEHTELNDAQFVVSEVVTANQYKIDYDATGDADEATGGVAMGVAEIFLAYSGTAGLVTLVSAVTNDVRVLYDDSKTEPQIVNGVQRIKEKLIEILS